MAEEGNGVDSLVETLTENPSENGPVRNEMDSKAGGDVSENLKQGNEEPKDSEILFLPGSQQKKMKKKKKKSKDFAPEVVESPDMSAADLRGLSATKLQEIKKAMELLNLNMIHQGPAKTHEEAARKHFEFWDTQPVPKIGDEISPDANEPIEPDKCIEDIRKEPLTLPQGFQWDTLDIDNANVLLELYTLLNENYVEDDDNMFRFDYSPGFLKWALQPPHWQKQWLCGVRVVKSKKLIGFISAVPALIRIYGKKRKIVEINFLCVHKKLRSKRVAPVLIREITRRVNLEGIFQAVYTAGVVLPKPIGTCRYWHRSLNPRKLIDVKFSHLSRNMTLQRTLKLYKLPETPKTPGFRVLEEKDAKQACALLSEYLLKFDLAPSFTEEEFRYWFLPREDIVNSFVVESNGTITDFVSFYTLPSTVMHHPVHKSLKAAYAFYNVGKGTPLTDLMRDALIVAKNMGYDVFNALDLMENKIFLEPLKFGIGDGNLQYYLYNWRCQAMAPNQIGLVLQ
ncbi:glycylpeptide N-tetradecanoyltransferase 2-like [Stegodyphus dumicola]|uniref:glycylpeptide N-tetradecanoyltransferase 2-like n=1 Tax=Stegodyphus dumicola TaxID=202533 RepID=UPI0015AE106A|nr:glycylpeptide N-tetradecanoyltransferase 2-like [Stegodyphus dumicola]